MDTKEILFELTYKCTPEVRDVAVRALEKQIPKKPVERFTGDEWICECPVCKGITYTPNEVDEKRIQYCSWCGQKFD